METIEEYGYYNDDAPRMVGPKDFATFMKEMVETPEQEEGFLVTLNNSFQVIGSYHIARGSATSCTIAGVDVLKRVMRDGAVMFAIGHTHPGGNTDPSENDIASWVSLVIVSAFMGVQALDHVILNPHTGDFSTINNNKKGSEVMGEVLSYCKRLNGTEKRFLTLAAMHDVAHVKEVIDSGLERVEEVPS